MKPLTEDEAAWYELLCRRFPNAKPRNLRRDARRMAQGKPAFLMAERPARAAKTWYDPGAPDSEIQWPPRHWKKRPARKGRPALTYNDLTQ